MPIEFLSTKLYIPPVRPTLMPRPRLCDRLAPTNANRMVLVSAPPGYGKTTLISSWLAENKCPACWLSLDDSDNDPVRFVQYLTRDLAQIIPAIEIQSQCLEAFPLDARIAGGMAQKHLLSQWHACHCTVIHEWSEEERRASFDEFASGIDIVSVDHPVSNDAYGDCFVFPGLDHTLLGTGIVRAIRQHGERCEAGKRPAPTRVLPARAAVFAMGIQWAYPSAVFWLEPMNRLRWSLYPQALPRTRVLDGADRSGSGGGDRFRALLRDDLGSRTSDNDRGHTRCPRVLVRARLGQGANQ